VTGEFHDVTWVVVFFNVGDAIFHGGKGVSDDSDCFHLGVCQVTGVKVAGCHIGLELLTPLEVGTSCDAGIEEPAPRFSVHDVAIHLPNLCSIVIVTDSDTWVGVFIDLPSARVFDGWLEVHALRQVSVHKKVVVSDISCSASLVLSVITYALASAGRWATIRGKVFLHFPLSASIL